MVLFIILGIIVVLTFVLLGVLVYMLSKEGKGKDEDKAVPLTDLDSLKKELSPESSVANSNPAPDGNGEVIPAFVPKEPSPSELELETYKKRVQEMEDELKAVKQTAEEQADVTREMVLSLTKENQSLKNKQSEASEDPQKLAELQTQLESSNAKVRQLEEEIAQLNAKLSAAQAVPDDTLSKEMESLKSQQVELIQKNEELAKANEELKYDMVKARAQSSGLDRVSSNYKAQLEENLKKVNTSQEAVDQLTQAKNSLEAMVDEIKIKNEELVQKDQLNQFELEKNREKLVALERECEDLKAKLSTPKEQGL